MVLCVVMEMTFMFYFPLLAAQEDLHMTSIEHIALEQVNLQEVC